MNIKITDSWLREYLKTEATEREIADSLSLSGPSVEKLVPVGKDFVYDIEITSNRVDMASVIGIAREANAILPRKGWKTSLTGFELSSKNLSPNSPLPLAVEDKNHLCPRIMAVVLDNLNIGRSSDFMRNRLEQAGIRSLNNVVDITNYVMLETGHPVHAFDYDRINSHSLIIRFAKKGEVITTLDEKKYILDTQDVVIDDGTGRIIDLPGIMGCFNSVVINTTKRIILFIESNNPVSIRRTSMKYGIRTMAATINEKNPDPELVETALLRGIKLYQDITGAKIASPVIDIYPQKPVAKNIEISAEFINKIIGVKLPNKEISDILTALQFQVKTKAGNFIVTPASFRASDVQIKEDLVEEVARIYGYYNLPGELMSGKIPVQNPSKQFFFEDKIKTALKYLGFTETYSYSFISQKMIADSGLEIGNHLEVANPLTSDIQFMRTSLFPSLLNTICTNQYLTQPLRLFELSNIYLPKKIGLPSEMPSMVLAANDNFFELKGIVETIFSDLGLHKIEQKVTPHHFMHPKLCISFIYNNTIIASLGLLQPQIQFNFNIKSPLMIAEVYLNPVLELANTIKKYRPIPKHPPVIEDLALLIPENIKLGEVIKNIYNVSPQISKVKLIDMFQNTTTLRVFYQQDNKNNVNSDTTLIRQNILRYLLSNYKIKLKAA